MSTQLDIQAQSALPDREHYMRVRNAINRGQLVPFLGAGINLSNRPRESSEKLVDWKAGPYLPSGRELAEDLIAQFGRPTQEVTITCPQCGKTHNFPKGKLNTGEYFICPIFNEQKLVAEILDLPHVSQYVEFMVGEGPLNEYLHETFDVDYQPTSVHNFFATLPKLLREKNSDHPYQLIVTTNYDDTLERTFEVNNEPFDLVWYGGTKQGEARGRFVHRTPEGKIIIIKKPTTYRNLSLNNRTVILKIHGAVTRTDSQDIQDSFVITEDQYIDYVACTDVAKQLPVNLETVLKNSHILFLGYSLSDWNLRVILRRIWEGQKIGFGQFKSWAIQLQPENLDVQVWREQRGVIIYDMRLDDYITHLVNQLRSS